VRFLAERIGNRAKINLVGTVRLTCLAILAVPDRLGRKHPFIVAADKLNDFARAQIPPGRKLAVATFTLTALVDVLSALVQDDKA
jgi:hypothetical protein